MQGSSWPASVFLTGPCLSIAGHSMFLILSCLFNVYGCVAGMLVCAPCVCSALRGQRKVSYHQGLELGTVVRGLVSLGIELGFQEKQLVLLIVEPFLQPHLDIPLKLLFLICKVWMQTPYKNLRWNSKHSLAAELSLITLGFSSVLLFLIDTVHTLEPRRREPASIAMPQPLSPPCLDKLRWWAIINPGFILLGHSNG